MQALSWDELPTATPPVLAEEHSESGRPRRVEVIFPPTQGIPRFAEGPESLVAFHNRLYFAANFEDGRRALWTSDGSETGTFAVKTFPALPPSDWLDRLGQLTPAGNQLFFTASDAAHGAELWVSDGSSGGTRQVVDLTPGPESSRLSSLTALGGTLVFFREVPGTDSTPVRIELWKSDGTAAGTARLRHFGAEASVGWRTARLGGVLLFFVTDPVGGTGLWRTDGTRAGTQRVRTLAADATRLALYDVSRTEQAVFFTMLAPDSTTEVWMTDGSRSGTTRLYTHGPERRALRLLTALGDSLYVTLTDSEPPRMAVFRLRLDNQGGKEHVATLPNPYGRFMDAVPYLINFTTDGERIFFQVGISSSGPAPRDTQLWVTDGTKPGTRLLRRPLSLSDEYESPLYAADERLVLFSAFQDSAGIEPWVTDGTARGTRQLADVEPVGSSYPRAFTRVGDQVFFSAFDETAANQLWVLPLRRP